jgi:hypothetical protein
MSPEQASDCDIGRCQTSLDLNEYWPTHGLGEQQSRIEIDEVAPVVEMAELEVGPWVSAHFLSAIASADGPERLEAFRSRLEVVEEDERPAGARIERAVEEVVFSLTYSWPRGSGVEDAAGRGAAASGR